MQDVIDKLMSFGFTRTEATIYVTLLRIGKMNGYKIAKELNISRSNVYQILESLYKKGYVFMTPGDSKEYEAKDSELLFKELERGFHQNLEIVREQLKKMKKAPKKDYYLRIEGYNNVLKTLQEIIKNAEEEIYMNIDFPLDIIEKELKEASSNGVRVIIFSFNKLKEIQAKGIEYYHKTNVCEDHRHSKRIMVVADLKKSFVVTNSGEKITGTLTDNPEYIQIISEHIHSDIYMARLAKLYEKSFEKNISINSLHEKKNFIY